MKKDPLAEIDIVEIAKIAAAIPTPGLTNHEKIKDAYSLLQIADSWRKLALRTKLTPLQVMQRHESGEDFAGEEYEEEIAAWHSEHEKALENPVWERLEELKKIGPDGEFLPIPFAKGLATLMPQVKPALRMRRFLLYLKTGEKKNERSGWSEILDKTNGQTSDDFEFQVDELTKEGIPWGDFQFICLTFPAWWVNQDKINKSAAGMTKKPKDEASLTEESNAKDESQPLKGKQGQVLKKKDKRKGARR